MDKLNSDEVSKVKRVIPVIRSYNNSAVIKQVKALRNFLRRIIVVTDAKKDRGATKAWLAELNDPSTDLIEMQEGYTWSNALNRALGHIQLHNMEFKRSGLQYDYLLNISVEARLEQSHLEVMLAKFDDQTIGVVGTTFDGRHEGNRITLGPSYWHPRNTAMLIRLSAFEHRMLRDFDGFCDDAGGMEDFDFLCRMEVFTEMKTAMLDLKVPLIVGKYYEQAGKELREREAMKKILARYSMWTDRLQEVVRKFS